MSMTMSSLIGLADMEALLWGPSSPTADPMGSPLRLDEDGPSIEGGASPLSSSFSSSPPPPRSPPSSSSSPLLQDDKPEVDVSFPWLSPSDQLGHSCVKEDAFSGLDWMAERVDLSQLDLDSLMDCCGPDELPSSPEELMASLECPLELDSLALPSLPPLHHLPALPVLTESFAPSPSSPPSPPSLDHLHQVHSPPLCVPEVQQEMEIKSEPLSPASSPPPAPPSPPTFTLDLGSEVDVSDCDSKPVVRTAETKASRVPKIVFSFSPTRIVLLLTSDKELSTSSTTTTVAIPQLTVGPAVRPLSCYSPTSAPTQSPRGKPYPSTKAKPNAAATPPGSAVGKMRTKCASGGAGHPKEKKLKKMEQNKTAATRYRQKKRGEQEALSAELGELEQRNQELEERADSLATEIRYLKELMDEVRLARRSATSKS